MTRLSKSSRLYENHSQVDGTQRNDRDEKQRKQSDKFVIQRARGNARFGYELRSKADEIPGKTWLFRYYIEILPFKMNPHCSNPARSKVFRDAIFDGLQRAPGMLPPS